MATADKRERRNHFRGKPRPGRRVDVQFRVGDEAPISAFTRNIGVGGAFIVTPSPADPGTVVAISVHVPNQPQPLEVKAEVRWTARPGRDELTGMGVKFHPLDVEKLLQLSEYFASLAGHEDPPATS